MAAKQSGDKQEMNGPEAINAKPSRLDAVNDGLGVSLRIEIDDGRDMGIQGENLTSVLAEMIEEEGYEATSKRIERLAHRMQVNSFDERFGGLCWQDAHKIREHIISTAAIVLDEIIQNEEWDGDDDDIDDEADYDDCFSDDEEKRAAAIKRIFEGDDRA